MIRFNSRKLTAIAVTTFIMLQSYSPLGAVKLPEPEFNPHDAAEVLHRRAAASSHAAVKISESRQAQEAQIALLEARQRECLDRLNQVSPPYVRSGRWYAKSEGFG